jgi:hypothetical protein
MANFGPFFAYKIKAAVNDSAEYFRPICGYAPFYFAVDLEMNGSLDMDSIYIAWVRVNVVDS